MLGGLITPLITTHAPPSNSILEVNINPLGTRSPGNSLLCSKLPLLGLRLQDRTIIRLHVGSLFVGIKLTGS